MRMLATVLLAALPLAAGSVAAQGRRVTLTPTVGYASASPLFEHEPRFDPAVVDPGGVLRGVELRDLTRLRVEGAPTAGARVSVPLGARWTVHAEGAYGSTEFEEVRQSGVYREGQLVDGSESRASGDAEILSASAGLSRRFVLPGGSTEAEAGIGGGLHRFRLEKPECVTLPPSQGLGGRLCGGILVGPAGLRFEESYDVPAAAAHLLLRRRVTGRIGVEGRAGYSVGRTDTESYYQDLIPQLDEYEAPKRTTVRTTQLSLGVYVGL